MNRALHTLITVICGIWLGGLLMLFLSVQSLFKTFPDHVVAGLAASGIFTRFNECRLIMACSALLLTFFWWCQDQTRPKMAFFALLALAIVAAAVSSGFLAPRLEHLRLNGATQSLEFKKLHGLSMGIYLIETLFVLVANLILPGLRKQRRV